MNKIHETSIVSSSAKIGENVSIGPYCKIDKEVTIADNVTILSHVSISGKTYIGDSTKIWPFAVIGSEPQDMKYDGENGSLEIGVNNNIREHVTIHFGTKDGGMVTKIGDNNLFMVGAHIAHDCKVGSNCVFANNATLGGHVEVGDWAILGGLAAVHQWGRVGCHSFIGGLAAVTRDLLPYGMAIGNRANLEGINLVGMRRRGFAKEDISEVKKAYSVLFDDESKEFVKRIEELKKIKFKSQTAMNITEFVSSETNRAYVSPSVS